MKERRCQREKHITGDTIAMLQPFGRGATVVLIAILVRAAAEKKCVLEL